MFALRALSYALFGEVVVRRCSSNCVRWTMLTRPRNVMFERALSIHASSNFQATIYIDVGILLVVPMWKVPVQVNRLSQKAPAVLVLCVGPSFIFT